MILVWISYDMLPPLLTLKSSQKGATPGSLKLKPGKREGEKSVSGFPKDIYPFVQTCVLIENRMLSTTILKYSFRNVDKVKKL